MNSEDLAYLPTHELATRIKERQISPVEVVTTYLERIDRFNPSLNAYITVCREDALRNAHMCEKAIVNRENVGPLHGVPIGLKDQIYTKEIRTTAGSKILSDFVPTQDATLVTKLKDAGAIILGKQNLTEFALGGTVEFPYGEPKNPWNLNHSPAGSSSGSGIASAAALCSASIGEDTGGSVRGPASANSIVGLRPSWGRVSRNGIVPVCWSLDTAGPLTRTVQDTALILNVISGHDPKDEWSSHLPVPDYSSPLTGDIKGIRIGVIKELLSNSFLNAEVQEAVTQAASMLEGLGAEIEEISLPLVEIAGPIFMAICDSEGAAYHRDWLEQTPDNYDQATRRRLFAASLLPLSLYYKAQQIRTLIRQQILEAFEHCQVLLCPTSGTPPPTIQAAKNIISSPTEAVESLFKGRMYSTPFVLSATPALSMPCGFTQTGLPIGLQLISAPFDEVSILRVAHAYEQTTSWHKLRPGLI